MNTQDANEHVQDLSDRASHLKDRAQDILRDTDNCIRANPVPAVLMALGVGFAIGVLTRYCEPPKREPWQEALDEIRGVLASGAKRGKKAYAHSAEAVRDAVEHAVEKARDIDVDPVTNWWKKFWS
jgi:ElaB/YqjD/DUF883 family membrane-anchored ribosome-binding protein